MELIGTSGDDTLSLSFWDPGISLVDGRGGTDLIELDWGAFLGLDMNNPDTPKVILADEERPVTLVNARPSGLASLSERTPPVSVSGKLTSGHICTGSVIREDVEVDPLNVSLIIDR